jgi:RNA polymerase sigma-70 factor (ECF subfamily)
MAHGVVAQELTVADAEYFQEAIRRVRAGDHQAAAELVRKYEPLIRREVRIHLEDRRLRRLFDSMDVVQSVLASFFVRAAAGEYDLDHPAQLVRLFTRMARNKLASAARKHYRLRRDARRVASDDNALQTMPAVVSQELDEDKLADAEVLRALRNELTAEELQMAVLRAEGRSWSEIAATLGGTAQARRMQLRRGVERAGKKLGLGAADHL